jgi:hypothetical protein
MRLRVKRSHEVQALVERQNRTPRRIIFSAMTSIDNEIGSTELLREAADPSTSPWRLATLADNSEPDVRMAIAANPSVSLLTVLRLGRDVEPRVRAILAARYGIGA